MKALIKFSLTLKSGDDIVKDNKVIYLEKEVSMPVLPQAGTRVEGFEIVNYCEDLLVYDQKNGFLGTEHGFEIRQVEFELKGDVLIPVIWFWETFDKFDGQMVSEDGDDMWDGLNAEQAFNKLFMPQIIKYKFKIAHNPFKR